MQKQNEVKAHFKYVVILIWLFCWQNQVEGIPLQEADTVVSAGVLDEYQLRCPETSFLQEFREDPAFNYSYQEVNFNWFGQFKRWLLRHLPGSQVWIGDRFWLQLTLEILLLVFVIFLIYKLIRGKYTSPFGRKVKGSIPGDWMTGEQVNGRSYAQLLEDALKTGNYILAIRIQYGYTLHLLDGKGMIHADAHCPNQFYYYELKEENVRERFGRLSRIFDCVCYGEFGVDKELYSQLEQEFKDFQGIITG